MKYIFDFDDVLFHNTSKLKPHMYDCIAQAGIAPTEAKEHYDRIRNHFEHGFTLRSFIDSLFDAKNIFTADRAKLHEDILKPIPDLVNNALVEFIKQKGKDNCYMVTHGNNEYQTEKIKRAGIYDLFSQIIIVQGTKKEAVENICAKHLNEEIVFIDDKISHLENLDFKKYPNLKTILYTGQALDL